MAVGGLLSLQKSVGGSFQTDPFIKLKLVAMVWAGQHAFPLLMTGGGYGVWERSRVVRYSVQGSGQNLHAEK